MLKNNLHRNICQYIIFLKSLIHFDVLIKINRFTNAYYSKKLIKVKIRFIHTYNCPFVTTTKLLKRISIWHLFFCTYCTRDNRYSCVLLTITACKEDKTIQIHIYLFICIFLLRNWILYMFLLMRYGIFCALLLKKTALQSPFC